MPQRVLRVQGIRHWSRGEFASAVDGFADRYKSHFEIWLETPPARRPIEFGRILRSWQATRGRVMRRARIEQAHERPHLDDLLASVPVDVLGTLTTATISTRNAAQDAALRAMWAT